MPTHTVISMDSSPDRNYHYRALSLQLCKGTLRALMGLLVQPLVILRRISSVVYDLMIGFCGTENIEGRSKRNGLERCCLAILLLCVLTFSTIMTIHAVTFRWDEPKEHRIEMVDETGRKSTLKSLEMNLVNEIQRISHPSSCKNTSTLHCSFPKGCGLGCQLHRRAACLVVSYSMRIPLIHDTTTWQFGKWENAFQPLGSHCPINERTIHFNWKRNHRETWKEFRDHFRSGIPIDQDLLRAIQDRHSNPYLWFVGQFLKYTMRLSSKLGPVVNNFLSELPRGPVMVGLHIRRTDKVKDDRRTYHDIKEYVIPADPYFRYVNCSLNRTVYLASEDHTLLSQARNLYSLPQWRFIGLNLNQTLHTQKPRDNFKALVSITKDVVALTTCDYVVCDFISNICRLTAELMSADNPDGFLRVKSLGSKYAFIILGDYAPVGLVPRDRHE